MDEVSEKVFERLPFDVRPLKPGASGTLRLEDAGVGVYTGGGWVRETGVGQVAGL
jgi:hypothetical protein